MYIKKSSLLSSLSFLIFIAFTSQAYSSSYAEIEEASEDPAVIAYFDQQMLLINSAQKPVFTSPVETPEFDRDCCALLDNISPARPALNNPHVARGLIFDEEEIADPRPAGKSKKRESRRSEKNKHEDAVKKIKHPQYSANRFLGRPESPQRLAPENIHPAILANPYAFADEDVGADLSLAPMDMTNVIDMGIRIKLLANVYAGRLNETTNIFVPRYMIRVNGAQPIPGYFMTPKGEICIFASGGTQNHWEKSIGKVYEAFFKQKVKIIRARWINKHCRNEKGTSPLDEYRDRETELHSELYYNLFFKKFFAPLVLAPARGNIQSLVIEAFSWWEVCDQCGIKLENQKILCEQQYGITNFSYRVSAAQKYKPFYTGDVVQRYRTPQDKEAAVWKEIWKKVEEVVKLHPDDNKQKKYFWTKTAMGLELCKWLGQAFQENLYTLESKTAHPARRGDILKFYNAIPTEDKVSLGRLLDYLRDKNWELSCWYKAPYLPNLAGRQILWKKHAKQVVIPHFGWELVSSFKDEDKNHHCQMCGQQNLVNINWVYHPKFRVNKKFLNLPEEVQNTKESDLNFTIESPYDDLPDVLKLKRRQSLVVGSDCLEVLELSKYGLQEYKGSKTDERLEIVFKNQNAKHNEDDALEISESIRLLKWMKEQIDGTGQPIKIRQITSSKLFGIAADYRPFLNILLRDGDIKKLEDNSYITTKK